MPQSPVPQSPVPQSRGRQGRVFRAALAALALAAADPALAQTSSSAAAMKRYRDDLKQCLIRNAGWASARAEATRDAVADYAASRCEKAFIAATTRRKLMTRAEAQTEVNVMAYQFAERILSN